MTGGKVLIIELDVVQNYICSMRCFQYDVVGMNPDQAETCLIVICGHCSSRSASTSGQPDLSYTVYFSIDEGHIDLSANSEVKLEVCGYAC